MKKLLFIIGTLIGTSSAFASDPPDCAVWFEEPPTRIVSTTGAQSVYLRIMYYPAPGVPSTTPYWVKVYFNKPVADGEDWVWESPHYTAENFPWKFWPEG